MPPFLQLRMADRYLLHHWSGCDIPVGAVWLGGWFRAAKVALAIRLHDQECAEDSSIIWG